MKKVVSVSLGSAKGDFQTTVRYLGQDIEISRTGTNGSLTGYAAKLRELDGKVDAIGLGGADMYVYAGGRRYTFREISKLAALVKQTPVVDGSGLKNTLERECVRYLNARGIVHFSEVNTLMVCAVDRFGMAEEIAAGGNLLGHPEPVHRAHHQRVHFAEMDNAARVEIADALALQRVLQPAAVHDRRLLHQRRKLADLAERVAPPARVHVHIGAAEPDCIHLAVQLAELCGVPGEAAVRAGAADLDVLPEIANRRLKVTLRASETDAHDLLHISRYYTESEDTKAKAPCVSGLPGGPDASDGCASILW